MNTTFIKTIISVVAASVATLSTVSADQTPPEKDAVTFDNIYEATAAIQERTLDIITASAEERIEISVKEDDSALLREATLASR